MAEHTSRVSLDSEPPPSPLRTGMSWAELQPHLPARAPAIVALYDEVWPDRVPRMGWRVRYSGQGDLRVADANGDPVEPAKPALVMLEPQTLDNLWDLADYTFDCAALDSPAPRITMRDGAGIPALYLELDPNAGLIRRITSPDLPSDEFRLELRDYRVAETPAT